jgi:hypothetical protein
MLGKAPRPINLAAPAPLPELVEPAATRSAMSGRGDGAPPPRRTRYATLGVQVLPPSFVFRMVPKPPTIQPLFWS